jgi:hypothetical protein
MTNEEMIIAGDLIAEINQVVGGEIYLDNYYDCLIEDIDFSRADGELSDLIHDLLFFGISAGAIRYAIRQNNTCIVGDMRREKNSINAMPVGEEEHYFGDLRELSDEAYEYVRKNIDAFLSKNRDVYVYRHRSEWVHLVVDVKKVAEQLKGVSK